MKIKSTLGAVVAVFSVVTISSPAATLLFFNSVGSLGETLDEAQSGTFAVPEIPSLNITVVSVASNATNSAADDLNATASSFGINNGDSGDDTSAFDAASSEFVTFSFDKDVSITSFKLTSFTGTESFIFAGKTVLDGDADGSNVYTFLVPELITANTSFTLGATNGVVGLENVVLTVVPEPTTGLLGAFGSLLLLRRRR